MRLAKEKIPKTKLACFDFQFLDHWNNGVPTCLRVIWQLSMGNLDRREYFILKASKVNFGVISIINRVT